MNRLIYDKLTSSEDDNFKILGLPMSEDGDNIWDIGSPRNGEMDVTAKLIHVILSYNK